MRVFTFKHKAETAVCTMRRLPAYVKRPVAHIIPTLPMFLPACLPAYLLTEAHACIRDTAQSHIYIYIYICIYVYTYIHIYIYTHTYTYSLCASAAFALRCLNATSPEIRDRLTASPPPDEKAHASDPKTREARESIRSLSP